MLFQTAWQAYVSLLCMEKCGWSSFMKSLCMNEKFAKSFKHLSESNLVFSTDIFHHLI